MKVLFTTNILAFYRVDFFNELGKKCDLKVIYEQDKNKERNAKFYDFNNKNFKVEKAKFSIKYFNNLLKEKFDIIVIGTYATKISALFMMLMRIKKVKFIINADGGFIDLRENKISKFLKTFFISKASYYLSTSKGTNKYLEYYGAKKENIFIYPFTSLFEKDIIDCINNKEKKKLKKELDLKCDILFLSVGQFIYRKGYDIFLEAIKNHKFDNCLFVLISGGEEKQNYEKFMRDNNIKNVLLIDYCAKEDLKKYYQAADVFFFPSREDIWGLVTNEAMANGLPIISSNNVLASKELLPKEYLYDYNNSKALYKLINKLYKMGTRERNKIGKQNLDKIKNYTLENMAEKHREIFEDIINGKD